MRAPWRRATATGSPPAKTRCPVSSSSPTSSVVLGHQPIDLRLGLHDRAHVMVEREANAALRADARATAFSRSQNARPLRVARAPAARTAARPGCRRCCRDLLRTPSPCSPSPASRSRWSATAAISSSADRRASCALYQPETSVKAVAVEDRAAASLAVARKFSAELDAGVARHSRVSARQTSSGMSPPSSGMSSLVQVIGLMPSKTAMRGPLQKAELDELASQLLRASGNGCRGCRGRVAASALAGLSSMKTASCGAMSIAIEQDAKDARIGLDHAFLARHDDAVEPRRGNRSGSALDGNVSADQLVSA